MAASLNSTHCTRLPRTCLFQPLSPLILVAWTRVYLIDRELGLLERFRRYCRLSNARMMDKQHLMRTVNKGIFLTVSFVPESQPSAILAQKIFRYCYFWTIYSMSLLASSAQCTSG